MQRSKGEFNQIEVRSLNLQTLYGLFIYKATSIYIYIPFDVMGLCQASDASWADIPAVDQHKELKIGHFSQVVRQQIIFNLEAVS